ncbi:MAG: ribokinase [Candidatus Lindowbacteria bacterium]|nr:ribokinase [Candidatus Lindowbacteria bacterium]
MPPKPVVVVGSANIDMVVKTPRFPRPGETITGDSFYTSFGGKGANQAVTVARLGLPVSFVGCVGDDSFGREMIANMRSAGIDTSHVKVAGGHSSGTAVIIVDSQGQNQIVVAPGANLELRPEHVDDAEQAIANARVLVTQLEIPAETVARAIHLAAKHHVPIILNPAPAPRSGFDDSLLQEADFVVPNETEAEALTGVRQDSDNFAEAAIGVLKTKGARIVVITLGEKGSVVADSAQVFHIPAFAIRVEDTTAAGDAFVGALAAGRGFFPDLRSLTRFASAVAALVVTKKGAQTSLPSRAEVDDFLVEREPQLLESFRAMTCA